MRRQEQKIQRTRLNNEPFLQIPDSAYDPISSDMVHQLIEEMSAKNLLIDKMVDLGMSKNVPNVKRKDDRHIQRAKLNLNAIDVPRCDWMSSIKLFNGMLDELKDMDKKKDMLGGKEDE